MGFKVPLLNHFQSTLALLCTEENWNCTALPHFHSSLTFYVGQDDLQPRNFVQLIVVNMICRTESLDCTLLPFVQSIFRWNWLQFVYKSSWCTDVIGFRAHICIPGSSVCLDVYKGLKNAVLFRFHLYTCRIQICLKKLYAMYLWGTRNSSFSPIHFQLYRSWWMYDSLWWWPGMYSKNNCSEKTKQTEVWYLLLKV